MKKTLILVILTAASVVLAQGFTPPQQQGLRRSGIQGNRSARPNALGQQTAVASEASVDELADGSTLNFNQTALELVFEAYGRMVGKTILKDPQCPSATITLKSEKGQKLTQEEQIEAIEVVLEMNGVHLEPYGEKFMRALPRKDARKEGIPLLMDADAQLRESGKVVSMMLPFKHISMEDAQKILDQFKSATGILIAIERTNSILITDTEMNINRMREIAKTIDVATPVTEVVEYIQIRNANAVEIKQVLDSIVQESMKEQEKNGKTPQGNAQQSSAPHPPFGIGGRNRQQNNQPQTPASNQSLVMAVSEADRGMIRGKVVTIADERSNKILIITNASNMKFFKQVIEALDVETTPDTVVNVYRLKYAEAEDVSDMINDLIGNSVSSKNSKGNQNQNAKKGQSGSVTHTTAQSAAKKPANQRTGDAKAGELSKENTTVLADKRINGLVVMTMKELVPTIEKIIDSMDIKLSQVLIETVIIEVGLGDDLQTGVDWVRLGDKKKVQTGTTKTWQQKTDDDGYPLYWTDEDHSGTALTDQGFGAAMSLVDTPVYEYLRTDLWRTDGNTSSMLGGGGGTGANLLNNMVGLVSSNASEVASLLSPAGSGLNWFLKSDDLNLGAVIKASQTDSRSKYIASPIIMTLDNKEATIEATEMKYLFKGYTYSGSTYNGTAVPDYEQKELGITIKVTPKINPNGTVMLTIEEEYSQEGAGQKITSSDGKSEISAATTVTRKMSADSLLENGQTVIFGGLTQTLKTQKEGGIPILKDIPYVGKWLFGYVSDSESRSELLVFMTPYVLDDAQAAQAEALRRKKTMSDPRPWEDHGWSASNLADPISRKEQMRRIKDEWRIQDEERKTRIDIEKEKIKRAKKLKEMSREERDMWLNMHKEELEEEAREALEEKMLDKDSQEELQKLMVDVRAKKTKETDAVLKMAEQENASQNERARLDAEKKAMAAEKVVEKKEEPAK